MSASSARSGDLNELADDPNELADLAIRLRALGPVIAALVYPVLLIGFHRLAGYPSPLGPIAAAFILALSFAIPLYALAEVARLGGTPNPTRFERRAVRLALLVVAAPPLYVLTGVASGLLGLPISDLTVWLIGWAVALIAGLATSEAPAPTLAGPQGHRRVLHGVLAALLCLFFAFHLTNHLIGLIGPEAHGRIMAAGRIIYRSRLIEPLLVALLLSQILLGAGLARRWTAQPLDRLRALQVGSGAYIGIFALTHLNSAFVSARWVHQTATDWAWASGAPEGLIADAWNIRLLPHYAFGALFLILHLSCGLRVILTAHGTSSKVVSCIWRSGIALAVLVAALIVAALCGARV